MNNTRIPFDKTKFSRKRYRNSIKTLRKHLKWDGLDVSKHCKIEFQIKHLDRTPIVISDNNVDFYYNPEDGKLQHTVTSSNESPDVITLE